MNVSRIELAKMDANKVRRNAALFATFKEYVTEDAKYLYPNGKLPQGCFGCQFQSFFAKWKSFVLFGDNKKTKTLMAKSNKGYELVDKDYKVYFEGGILSKDSPAEDWLRWLEYPVEKEKLEKRKSVFSQLPTKPDEVKEITEETKSVNEVKPKRTKRTDKK